MANVGSSNLRIVPKFDGLTASVNKALAEVDARSGGVKLGQNISGGVQGGLSGLASSGAIVGVFSQLTARAMDTIGSHVGSAVARLDTLKNYPQVMQALGVSSDEAQSSIQTMSDRLQGLPTTLDAMSSTVQGIYAASKDAGVSLTQATEAGLALNDMLLSGGGSAQVAASAMEQFRQMLAKGKPDMQDWRSLMSAAPGQMDQLAKSMLGASATANDLYYALGGGKDSDVHLEGIEHASITVTQLMDALVALDKEGGAGLASFSSQASEAQGGIGTAMANMSNAVTRGIADVMDEIGRENIVVVINDLKSGIRETFSVASRFAAPAAEAFRRVWTALKPLAPIVAGVVSAFAGLQVAQGGVLLLSSSASVLSGAAAKASTVLVRLAEAAGTGSGGLSSSLLNAAAGADGLASMLAGPVGIAVAAAGVGLTLLVGHLMSVKQAQDQATTATDAFQQAINDTSRLQHYTHALDSAGMAAQEANDYISDMTSSWQAHADTMSRNADTAKETIGTWSAVREIFHDLIGQESLTAEEQGRLTWALQQYNEVTGETVTATDVLNGYYTDQEGNVIQLRSAVDQLTQSRITEARTAALTANLTEAYQAKAEATGQLARTQAMYNDALAQATEEYRNGAYGSEHMTEAEYAQTRALALMHDQQLEVDGVMRDAMDVYNEAAEHLNQANEAVENNERALGRAAEEAQGLTDRYDSLVQSGSYMQAALLDAGVSVDEFARAVRSLGVDTETLSNLAPAQMTALAQAYRDNGGDIEAALASIGEAGEEVLATIDRNAGAAAQSAQDVKRVLSDWSGIDETLRALGTDVDGFSAALGKAGISASTLASIGASEFAAMAASCNGDVDAVISKLAELDSSSARPTIEVTDLATSTISKVRAFLNQLPSQKTITIHTLSTSSKASATGSIADVPYIPRHADGYIADGPTLTNNGWVGEDGAEAVLNWGTGGTVVPLTNTRYMRPIAEAIAKEMSGSTQSPLVANFYVSGSDNPEQFARRAMRQMAQIARSEGR